MKELGISTRHEVVLWNFTYKAHPYVESPKICFRCQRFGHHQTSCSRPHRCNLCGDLHDPNIQCTKEACCFRCKSKNHRSNDPSCEFYQKEKNIINSAAFLKIPYLKAKELLVAEQKSPPPAWGLSDFPTLPTRAEPTPSKSHTSTPSNEATEIKNLRDLNQKLVEEVANLRKEVSNLRLTVNNLSSSYSTTEAVANLREEVSNLRLTVNEFSSSHSSTRKSLTHISRSYFPANP